MSALALRVRVTLLVIGAGFFGAGAFGQPDKKDAPGAKAKAQEPDLGRYPQFLPAWLWRDQRRSAALDLNAMLEITRDHRELRELWETKDVGAVEKKQVEIARKLASKFALRDLAAGAPVFAHAPEKLKLAVQFDPEFGEQQRKTLTEATQLFLKYALDDDVIKTAFAESVEQPTPVPEKYVLRDGKPVTVLGGNLKYTEEYRRYLSYPHRPADAEAFAAQLRGALTATATSPALLVVSRFSGDVWWGKGHLDHYHAPHQRLTRREPSEGYLYIGLNSDRMKDKNADPHWNDAAFWASKIGHECLHSLGFDHPIYADAKHRDENNKGRTKAFVVAYEFALLDRIRKAERK